MTDPPTTDRPRNRPRLDYSPSSGAVGSHEHAYDDAPQSHDGRARTHTKFYPEEASDPSRNWKRMAQMQDGAYDLDDTEHKARVRTAERQRDLDIFAEQLRLTVEQRKIAQYIFDRVPSVEPYDSNEALLVAICTVAVNRSTTHVPPNADPSTERELRQLQGTDRLRDLRETLNVTKDQLRAARRTLHDQLHRK